MTLWWGFLVSVIGGLWIFSTRRKHFLATLLSLEMMVLGVFIMILMNVGGMGFLYSLIYLIYSSCEGALGLTILISMSRSQGSDYFNSFSLAY